jgi:hypothetical protein
MILEIVDKNVLKPRSARLQRAGCHYSVIPTAFLDFFYPNLLYSYHASGIIIQLFFIP